MQKNNISHPNFVCVITVIIVIIRVWIFVKIILRKNSDNKSGQNSHFKFLFFEYIIMAAPLKGKYLLTLRSFGIWNSLEIIKICRKRFFNIFEEPHQEIEVFNYAC